MPSIKDLLNQDHKLLTPRKKPQIHIKGKDTLKDTSLMPFGVHKGKRLAAIPDHYLKWFWKENKEQYLNKASSLGYHQFNLMVYIQDSFNHNEL